MNKKGAELSVNVIIIAAIGLAVLVVLFAIFTGRLGIFSKGVGETTNCQQACKSLGLEFDKVIPENEEFCDLSAQKRPLTGYYQVEQGVRQRCCCR